MIQGVTEAPQSHLVPGDGRAPARARQVILRDPAVDSALLVHRHRRHQRDAQQRAHPDQPEAARGAGARRARSSTACSPALAAVSGITLYLQPVQDLTVEDRVSRTQYQYSLEDPSADELTRGPAPGRAPAGAARARGTWPATSRTRASRRRSASTATPPRVSASRPNDRRRALQRLRPAPDLDDLHPAQPVPRRARGGARVPPGPATR